MFIILCQSCNVVNDNHHQKDNSMWTLPKIVMCNVTVKAVSFMHFFYTPMAQNDTITRSYIGQTR